MERTYYLVSTNPNTGTVTSLTSYAMTHAQCMVMKNKFNPSSQTNIQLEETALSLLEHGK